MPSEPSELNKSSESSPEPIPVDRRFVNNKLREMKHTDMLAFSLHLGVLKNEEGWLIITDNKTYFCKTFSESTSLILWGLEQEKNKPA